MLHIRVLGLLVALVCSVLTVTVTNAVCTTARVRKNYDRLTLDERLLYRRALQLAMDRGYYIKFVEMHMEKMSELEAHRVCMFTYWHRYFLLGFENMLRSLGPEFECLTIPYWDQMQHNARAMTGACTNMESCAPIIRDLGGSTSGAFRGLTINGAWVSGRRCVDQAPLNHFCESSSRRGTSCARCLPRGDLLATRFPSASNYASVYRQLFTSGGFTSTGKTVEEGMHNSIHAAMGGTMATFQSPADPLFWSHHAYVDLLLTIYLKCRVGLGRLTDAQKMNNAYAFVQCPRRDGAGFFTASSTVTMRDGELGLNPMQVNQPGQDLYPFFRNLPSRYYQLSDVTQLGVSNRYIYQIGGLVGQMGTLCDAARPARRRLEATTAEERPLCQTEDDDHESAPSQNETTSAPPSLPPALDDFMAIEYTPEENEVTAKVDAWTDTVREQLRALNASAVPDQTDEVIQMEKMVCMFYDQCRGGVEDYSDEFRKAFNVSEPPPCKRIVDELKHPDTPPCRQIKLPQWKQVMTEFFPCHVKGADYSGGL